MEREGWSCRCRASLPGRPADARQTLNYQSKFPAPQLEQTCVTVARALLSNVLANFPSFQQPTPSSSSSSWLERNALLKIPLRVPLVRLQDVAQRLPRYPRMASTALRQPSPKNRLHRLLLLARRQRKKLPQVQRYRIRLVFIRDCPMTYLVCQTTVPTTAHFKDHALPLHIHVTHTPPTSEVSSHPLWYP